MQTVKHENVNLKQALEQMQEQPQAGGQAQIATLFTRIQDDYDKVSGTAKSIGLLWLFLYHTRLCVIFIVRVKSFLRV